MKRKVIFGVAISAMVAFMAFTMNFNLTDETIPTMTLANIEALASSEATGNTVDCFSESKYKHGASYYDCGTCCNKEDKEGKGGKRTCTSKSC